MKACRFVKRETPAWVFSGKFYESFKNTFFYGTYSCDCFRKFRYENLECMILGNSHIQTLFRKFTKLPEKHLRWSLFLKFVLCVFSSEFITFFRTARILWVVASSCKLISHAKALKLENSRPEVICTVDVVKNVLKLTEKNPPVLESLL